MRENDGKGHGGEPRFQWSIQRSIKVKSLPVIASQLVRMHGAVDLEELEDRFNLKFGLTKTVGVVGKQRPFMRTMDFMRNDLMLLNNDYSMKQGIISSDDSDIILETIYSHAVEHLIPFRVMMEVFENEQKEIHQWTDFKETLSRDMILLAKKEFPSAFKDKNRKLEAGRQPLGVYGWRIEDNSLNRLVELGMLFGICSFVVLQHVRFLSQFKKAARTVIDFDDLVVVLKEKLPGFGPTMILTFDEIYEVTDELGILRVVVQDALLSGGKRVNMFTGGREGASAINTSGKNYHSVRFNERCF